VRDWKNEADFKVKLHELPTLCLAGTAFYGSVDDKKPLKTIDVFDCAARRFPNAAHIWLERLESISKANILDIFNRIPNTRISPIAAEFAQKIIEFNQHRLLNLRKTLP
jgi:hypothetical protein